MSFSARAFRITISPLLLSLLPAASLAQSLKATFSMMETGPGVNSLIKGSLAYKQKERQLQWTIAYPNAQTLAVPANPEKPTPEEEATLALYDRYLTPGSFAETQIRKAKGWKKQKDKAGTSYQAKGPKAKVRHTYVSGNLQSTLLELPEGRSVAYSYSKYSNAAGLGDVPMEITTMLSEPGKKTFKRLTLKTLERQP